MKQKELWTIIVVSAIVAVIASVVTASLMGGVLLGPRISTAVNANSCDADNLCEMNFGSILYDLSVGKDIDARDITARGSITAESRVYAGMDIYASTGLVSGDLSGNETAYVCTDTEGRLFRSNTACR